MRRWIPQLLAAGLVLTLVGRSWADEDAKKLLAKAIQAHGGEENLNKYKAGRVKTKGKIELGGGLDFTQEVLYLLPDKFKESLDLQIGGNTVSVITRVNGDKVSITANGMDIEVKDEIKEEMKNVRHMSHVSRLAPLKGKEFELSLLGEVKVDDKPALGMKVTTKGQRDIDLFFDTESGLLVKVERRGVDPMSGQEFAEERFIKEYQKVDGLPSPKKIAIHRDGKKFMEAEVTEMKHLETVDENEFTKP